MKILRFNKIMILIKVQAHISMKYLRINNKIGNKSYRVLYNNRSMNKNKKKKKSLELGNYRKKRKNYD